MKKWLRRIRGTIGMGLTWAAGWSGAGMVLVLALLVTTGTRPDVPVPLLFGAFGLLGGVTFSGILSLLEDRRSLALMSLRRFAAWGGTAGLLLSTAFVVAVSIAGDPAFLWNIVGVGPTFAVAGAASAAGSLALARRSRDQSVLETPDGMPRLPDHGPQ